MDICNPFLRLTQKYNNAPDLSFGPKYSDINPPKIIPKFPIAKYGKAKRMVRIFSKI